MQPLDWPGLNRGSYPSAEFNRSTDRVSSLAGRSVAGPNRPTNRLFYVNVFVYTFCLRLRLRCRFCYSFTLLVYVFVYDFLWA